MNFSQRIELLRAQFEKKKIDGFLTSYLPHLRYLSGFSGSNGLLFVTRKKILFFSDFRYKEQSVYEVTADEKIITQGSLFSEAAKKNARLKISRIGFEEEYLSYATAKIVKEKFHFSTLVAVRGLVEEQRAVKSEDEIENITRAIAISDRVFTKILGKIKPGISENDISAEISYWHRKYGASGEAFDTIAASGIRGALPHGNASAKKISLGEFVTIDFGCVYNGYHSDMTRTIAVGNPNSEMKKVYAIVLEAQQRACEYVKAGLAAKSLDAIARNVITKRGYGKYFGHSLGHGIGLEIHELPRLSAKSNEILRTGNVITIEPGIYLPQKFGVRIEDSCVVRDHGIEILTTSPKELIIL